MFYLKSNIDGFKVIIGPWIVHIAQFLTIIITIRPPEYPDNDEKTSAASSIYAVLVVGHFFVAALKLCTSIITNVLAPIYTVFMLACVVTLIYLCD